MKTYTVTGRVARFPAGFVLALTDAQVAPRAVRLEAVDGGFVVLEAVEFKQGEVVRVVSGEIGKGSLTELAESDAEVDGNSSNDTDVAALAVPLRKAGKVSS